MLVTCCVTLPPAKSPAEALYRKRCGNCHELPAPRDYTMRDWDRILPQMSVNAGLSQAQQAELLGWIQRQHQESKP